MDLPELRGTGPLSLDGSFPSFGGTSSHSMSATARIIATLSAAGLLTACVTRDAAAPARASTTARPVVVQGAMDVEIRKLAAALENAKEERVQGWTFWSGTLDGY